MTDSDSRWSRAILAAEVLAVLRAGAGGLWLWSRAGPVRDHYLTHLTSLFPHAGKIHPSTGEDALFGGFDMLATLREGRPVEKAGILQRHPVSILSMAERCQPHLSARLAQAIDEGSACLIACDESAGPDEALSAGLADRLGLFVDLDGLALRDVAAAVRPEHVDAARQIVGHVQVTDEQIALVTVAAADLGIASLRAPVLALLVARALAALSGRTDVTVRDLEQAVGLAYSHRAQPVADAPSEADWAEPEPDPTQAPDTSETSSPLADILVESARSALSPEVLSLIAAGRSRAAVKGSGGAGSGKTGNRRGRPLPARAGRAGGQARIDLVATLRAAAPMQKIRQQASGKGGLHFRESDLRMKRFLDTSDRLLVFAVDASGSSAMARLAEAKGAVEILLAEAYVRRDHVALVAFRGDHADTLLPPTRSLVQTKRRLGSLPGGGATPLAAGLKAALDLGLAARGRGMAPTLAVLTDGRANIGLDGQPGRAAAEQDATRMARLIRASGLPGIVIDTGARPQQPVADLAHDLGAAYIALPRADAARISSALSAAIGA